MITAAKVPCGSCPYRKDVPSGIWAQIEYDKLPKFDGEIIDQLLAGATGIFMCHQRDGNLCAGWLACHGPRELLAMRLASDKKIDPALFDYHTNVPVFGSGAEARQHGMKDIPEPGHKAKKMMTGITRKIRKEN
jgi:hypothetical protein